MPQNTESVTVRMPPDIQKNRMPPDIQKKLGQIAASMDRSRNWLINQAVEQYLELYDWQTEQIRQRHCDAENGGEFIPHDEAMRQMEDKIQMRLKP